MHTCMYSYATRAMNTPNSVPSSYLVTAGPNDWRGSIPCLDLIFCFDLLHLGSKVLFHL